MDSTHSKSKHSPQTPTQILREMTKELRKEIYKTQHNLSELFPNKPNVTDDVNDEIEYTKELVSLLEKAEIKSTNAKKKLEKIKKTLELPHLKQLQSANEYDAKIGHKSVNDEFFGFKNHLAVTEDEQLITALVVTNGNESDTPYFKELIEKSCNNGVDFNEVLGDTAYSSAKNLELAEQKEIKVISKLHPNVGAMEKKNDYVHFNKDAGTFECVCGHLASRNKAQKNKQITFSFSVKACKKCPHKEKCITCKSEKYKRVWGSEGLEIHKKQAIFQQSDYFKERYRRRGIIEGKNADLKGNYGLGRSRSTGLFSMKVQSFVTAFCANVVKITRLATV